MIQIFIPAFLVTFPQMIMVSNVQLIDWNVLPGILIIALIPVFIYFFVIWIRKKSKKKLVVNLEKNRFYFPDYLTMTIINNGNKATDVDYPLLVFSNLLIKRKLKLKGTNGYRFYPLYLEPGKSHELKIDLNHFYRYDRSLKRYPKATIFISDVKKKSRASKSVQLRKTLFS
jgi:hypothetical protein